MGPFPCCARLAPIADPGRWSLDFQIESLDNRLRKNRANASCSGGTPNGQPQKPRLKIPI